MKYILKTQQQQQQQLTLFDDSCQLAAVLQNSKKRKICVQVKCIAWMRILLTNEFTKLRNCNFNQSQSVNSVNIREMNCILEKLYNFKLNVEIKSCHVILMRKIVYHAVIY
ncbi:hypothetical protein T09_11068 [Trichinella sp. T9]|nr:hypothetical protein T09_11068 [Trichinella sp. T9]